MDFINLLKDFGPLVGVVIFFIWRDWKREENLVDRVQKLEDFNTEVLSNMVRDQAAVIATNTEVIRANTLQLKSMSQLMIECKVR